MVDEETTLVCGRIDEIRTGEVSWMTVDATDFFLVRAEVERHPDIPTLVVLQ